jgi:hypothetical protein
MVAGIPDPASCLLQAHLCSISSSAARRSSDALSAASSLECCLLARLLVPLEGCASYQHSHTINPGMHKRIPSERLAPPNASRTQAGVTVRDPTRKATPATMSGTPQKGPRPFRQLCAQVPQGNNSLGFGDMQAEPGRLRGQGDCVLWTEPGSGESGAVGAAGQGCVCVCGFESGTLFRVYRCV